MKYLEVPAKDMSLYTVRSFENNLDVRIAESYLLFSLTVYTIGADVTELFEKVKKSKKIKVASFERKIISCYISLNCLKIRKGVVSFALGKADKNILKEMGITENHFNHSSIYEKIKKSKLRMDLIEI